MNLFVTGGTGLVGSHVIQLLRNRGHSVKALVRDASGRDFVERLGATAVLGAVEDHESWSHAAGTDAVVHSAAVVVTRHDRSTYQSINVKGARNAATKAAELGIQLVHISSVAVYGRTLRSSAKQIDESSGFSDLPDSDFYADSKRKAEATIAKLVEERELTTVCLRPCVIYGERDRTFLPHVIRVLERGFAPLIGSGENSLSVVYAGNVAEAVYAALVHPEVTGPVNVANDGVVTQREFFTAVASALGKRVRLVRIPVAVAYMFAASRQALRRLLAPSRYPGFGATAVRFLTHDNPYTSERARRELRWNPTTPPVEAITRSARWFVDGR